MKHFLPYFVSIFLLFSFTSSCHAESSIAINEFLVHPSKGNNEWIELYNSEKKDLSEYWIDDDPDFSGPEKSAKKRKIADLQVDGKYVTTNQSYPYILLNSFLNDSEGETITFFDKDGNKVAESAYPEDPGIDITIGRVPDGTGELKKLAIATKGEPNSKEIFSPTEKPTKIPTQQKEPTATKQPTASKEKTTSLQEEDEPIALSAVTKNNAGSVSTQSRISLSGVPTSILGTSSAMKKSATPSATKAPQKKKASEGFSITGIALFIGGVCLIGCGILIFLKKINKKEV